MGISAKLQMAGKSDGMLTAEELSLGDDRGGHPLSQEQAMVLADGLLAIAEQVHNHPAAVEHSLNNWLD